MIPQKPQSSRQLRTDNRAVSEVIGAILIFALLFLLLVLIQVNAVPAANEQVEFEHSQRVAQDFQSLQDGIVRVSATGQEGAVTVETGVSYPSRFFLLNPPPAIGTIRTTGQQDLRIKNAYATGESRDFWNGDNRTYATTEVTYRPDYNELKGAGTLHLENSMLYRNFDGGNRYFDDPTGFVDGNRIRLTVLSGNFSRSSLATSVELAPVSRQQRTVTIEDDGEPITISFQTTLDNETLQEQIVQVEANVEHLKKNGDTATVRLAQGVSYELTMSKVRVGSTSVRQPNAEYITTVSGEAESLIEGQTRRVVVEVRDRFNNPVSGVDVTADTDGTLSEDTVTAVGNGKTDEEGQAVFVYKTGSIPKSVGNTNPVVTAQFDDGDTELEKASFTLDVRELDTFNIEQGGDTVSGINPETIRLTDVQRKSGTGEFSITLTNDGDTNVTMEEMRLLFYVPNNSPGSPRNPQSVNFTQYEINGGGAVPVSASPLVLYGEFSDTPDITLGPGDSVELTYDVGKGATNDDFIGLSIGYTGADRTNHFFTIP